MKLPSLNFNIFKKSSTKKKRITTNFGKRRSSTASSTHKNRRSSSGRKIRKRSITYYAPSKSKFYPTEHFPSLQRMATHATTVATSPLAVHLFQPDHMQTTVSTEFDSKLCSTGTLRTQTARHTYLCDDNREFHTVPDSYMQTKNIDCLRYQTQLPIDDHDSNTQFQKSIDPNGNFVYDGNYRLNFLNNNNNNNNASYYQSHPKECSQGVPSQSMLNAAANAYIDVSELQKQSQQNYLPTNLISAYNSRTMKSIKHLPNNVNHLTAFQSPTNSTQMNQSTNFGGFKKLDRHRRRKVRSFLIFFASLIASNGFFVWQF